MFVVYQDQILLLKHKKLNGWIPPGGHIELNEDPETSLWRELAEETGLQQADLTLISTAKNTVDSPSNKKLPLPFNFNVYTYTGESDHKHIDLSYLLASNTDQIQQNPEESNGLKWFSRQDLEDNKSELLVGIYEQSVFALDFVAKNGS
jgi:ADP-ribose pyrophosphatase YjhB (NUDIX family)